MEKLSASMTALYEAIIGLFNEGKEKLEENSASIDYLKAEIKLIKAKQEICCNVDPIDPTPIDPTPIDPTPIDPTPIDPVVRNINIVALDDLVEGEAVLFEAEIDNYDDVKEVDFYIDQGYINTERNHEYNTTATLPEGKFIITAVFYFDDGFDIEVSQEFFAIAAPDPVDPIDPIEPDPINPEPIDPGAISTSFDLPPLGFFDEAKQGLTVSWSLDAKTIAEGGVSKEQLVKATGDVFDDIKMHGDDYVKAAYGDKVYDPNTGKHHGIWKIKETVLDSEGNDREDEYLVICDPVATVDSWNDKYQFKASKGQLDRVTGNVAVTRRVVRFPSKDDRFGGFEPGHGKIFSGITTTKGTPTPPGNNTNYADGFGEYSGSVYPGSAGEFRKGDFYGSHWPKDGSHKDDNIYWGMAFYGKDERMVSEGFHDYQHEMWYCDLPTKQRHAIQLDKWIEIEEVVIRNTPGKADAVVAARMRYEGESDWRYMRFINDFNWLGDDSANPSKLRAGGLIFYYGGAPQNKTNRSVHVKEISVALK